MDGVDGREGRDVEMRDIDVPGFTSTEMVRLSRLLSSAKGYEDLCDLLVRAVQEIAPVGCRLMSSNGREVRSVGAKSPGSDEISFPLRDSCGVFHGALILSDAARIGRAARDGIEMLAMQAALSLGCMALHRASTAETAARQVAEFESSRLSATFEERLKEALGEKGVWADVFEGFPSSVCIVGSDLTYQAYNGAFGKWFELNFGYVPHVGQAVSDALAYEADMRARAIENWSRALRGDDFTTSWSIERNAQTRHYETRYAPLRNPDGTIEGAVQFSQDVTAVMTERHKLELAESALRQSQKMEAVGKLTGGLAHDFNNILTGIVGSLDIIGRRFTEGRSDGVARYIEIATASANRAASLTHRLLAFARRQPLDPRVTDVDALILGMSELLTRTMGPDVQVETTTAGTSSRILCDSAQLENSIINLAINAREAMPSGGCLLIGTADIELEAGWAGEGSKGGKYVQITVSDTGTGMSPEVMSHAIEPFYTTKGVGQGSGLGLSMVYGFARQSGGDIDIRSSPLEGTTIAMLLPMAAAAPIVIEPKQEPLRGRDRDATVLVVEDEPAVRMIVVEMLQDMGYRVMEAEDGGSGAKLLNSSVEIDLLVTDIGLPVLNGRQVATVARTTRPEIPILFMTGYSENATITEGFAGRTMLVTKPFRPSEMATAIDRMLA